MEVAKKMLLVDASRIADQPKLASVDRFKNPGKKILGELDRAMYEVLENVKLTADEKVERYNQLLLEYQSKSSPPPSIPQQVSVNSPPSVEYGYETTGIAKTYKNKADSLLSMLQRNPNITWNGNGMVTINGEVVQGSNITDLIKAAVTPSLNSKTEGWDSFKSLLVRDNIPRTLLGIKTLTGQRSTQKRGTLASRQSLTRGVRKSPQIKRKLSSRRKFGDAEEWAEL